MESKLKSSAGAKEKKCVRFKDVDVDDVEECGHEREVYELKEQVRQLEHEKFKLEKKLQVTNYDEVY